MVRKRTPTAVDVQRDAVEVIALQSFRPMMSREIEKGERFSRDTSLASSFPEFFAYLLPLSAIVDEK
jgi:hypothetical protein